MKNYLFASLFKKYRLRSEFATLSALGERLYKEGAIFEDSLFSHWQVGDRVPDRKTTLVLIRIFHKQRAMTTPDEANAFMESAGLGYLTADEKNIFLVGIQKQKSENYDNFLKTIEYSYNPLTIIEKQINHYLNWMTASLHTNLVSHVAE